jgi:hypothetical protein
MEESPAKATMMSVLSLFRAASTVPRVSATGPRPILAPTIGAHDVFYRGFREGKGIWGTWEILWDARGGFHIWPRSFAAANEEAVSAEEEMPAPAFKV